MSIKKTIVISALALTLVVTPFTSIKANSNLKTGSNMKISVLTDADILKGIEQGFRSNATKEEKQKAKDLYLKMVKKDEESAKYWNEIYKMNILKNNPSHFEGEEYSFKYFAEQFKEGLSKEKLKQAKDLYEKMVKAEKEGNFNDSEKIMKQLFELGVFDEGEKIETTGDIDLVQGDKVETKYEGNIDEYTFEIFSKEFKKDLSKETLKKAKDLFEKMIKQEEKGNYDDADKIMKQMNELGVFEEGEKIETIGDKAVGFADTKAEVSSVMTLEEFKASIVNNADQAKVNKAMELFKKAEACREEADKCWKQLLEMNIFDDGKDEK
ncbi:hypothetical protein PV797_16550 [Clostridiaceae bacterium M8S5]|nr:hypothetical protein PV797_16550 [Clostridiaceae bacterium M8S5]